MSTRSAAWGWLCAAGCSVSGHADVAISNAGHIAQARAEFVTEPSAEALLGLPAGSTTSELAFVSAADGEICFDTMLRLWPGGTSSFDVVVNVDGWNAMTGHWQLSPCADGGCLPDDSPLRRHPADGLFPSVRVLGGRHCVVSAAPTDRIEIFMGENGSISIEIAFDLARSPNDHLDGAPPRR
jgi:hypothetical protein